MVESNNIYANPTYTLLFYFEAYSSCSTRSASCLIRATLSVGCFTEIPAIHLAIPTTFSRSPICRYSLMSSIFGDSFPGNI